MGTRVQLARELIRQNLPPDEFRMAVYLNDLSTPALWGAAHAEVRWSFSRRTAAADKSTDVAEWFAMRRNLMCECLCEDMRASDEADD